MKSIANSAIRSSATRWASPHPRHRDRRIIVIARSSRQGPLSTFSSTGSSTHRRMRVHRPSTDKRGRDRAPQRAREDERSLEGRRPYRRYSALAALIREAASHPDLGGTRAVQLSRTEALADRIERRIDARGTRALEEPELRPFDEVGNADTDEAHGADLTGLAVLRHRVAQESARRLVNREVRIGRVREGPLASACLERRHAQLQCHRPPPQPGLAGTAADPLGQAQQRRLDRRAVEGVLIEGVLVADRLRRDPRGDLAVIDAARPLADRLAVRTEPRLEQG